MPLPCISILRYRTRFLILVLSKVRTQKLLRKRRYIWKVSWITFQFIAGCSDHIRSNYFFSGYVKASPDTALIISGLRKKPRFLIGKAGVKIPFFEKKDELSLRLVSVDVKTSSPVPTAD